MPNQYVMLFDRRAMPADLVPVTGGDVLFQLPDGHVSDQAEVPAGSAPMHSAPPLTRPMAYGITSRTFMTRPPSASSRFNVDGVLDGSHNNSRSWYWVPAETLELGKSHDTFWSGYTGFFDDFRIYNRVLSADEIAQLAGVVIRPTLAIRVSGSTATLSWSQTGFVLQENSDVSNKNGWADVSNGNVSR